MSLLSPLTQQKRPPLQNVQNVLPSQLPLESPSKKSRVNDVSKFQFNADLKLSMIKTLSSPPWDRNKENISTFSSNVDDTICGFDYCGGNRECSLFENSTSGSQNTKPLSQDISKLPPFESIRPIPSNGLFGAVMNNKPSLAMPCNHRNTVEIFPPLAASSCFSAEPQEFAQSHDCDALSGVDMYTDYLSLLFLGDDGCNPEIVCSPSSSQESLASSNTDSMLQSVLITKVKGCFRDPTSFLVAISALISEGEICFEYHEWLKLLIEKFNTKDKARAILQQVSLIAAETNSCPLKAKGKSFSNCEARKEKHPDPGAYKAYIKKQLPKPNGRKLGPNYKKVCSLIYVLCVLLAAVWLDPNNPKILNFTEFRAKIHHLFTDDDDMKENQIDRLYSCYFNMQAAKTYIPIYTNKNFILDCAEFSQFSGVRSIRGGKNSNFVKVMIKICNFYYGTNQEFGTALDWIDLDLNR